MSTFDMLNFNERRAGSLPVMISSISPQSLGVQLAAIASAAPASTIVSDVGMAANSAAFVPFHIVAPITAQKLFCYNGAAPTGNIDIGIYNESGTLLVSIGSTAQSGTNALQVFDIVDAIIPAGRHYLAVGVSSASATIFGVQPNAAFCQAMGMAYMAAAFVLPATVTLATAKAFVPIIGLAARTLVN